MKRIVIQSGKLLLEASLRDTPCAGSIYECLPLLGSANLWGDEIYFQVPCECGLEQDAVELLEPGDLAFWPTGRAFCAFFGRTPLSTDDRPRAYGPVNVIGRITGDHRVLREVRPGDQVTVRADDFALGG